MYGTCDSAGASEIDPLRLESKQLCHTDKADTNEPCSHAIEAEQWRRKYESLLGKFKELQAEHVHLQEAMGIQNSTVGQFTGDEQEVDTGFAVKIEPFLAGDLIEVKVEPFVAGGLIDVKQEPLELHQDEVYTEVVEPKSVKPMTPPLITTGRNREKSTSTRGYLVELDKFR